MRDKKFLCERLWTAKELISRTAMFGSVHQLYISHKTIGIPYYKFAGRLWFDPFDVDRWIKKHRKEFRSFRKASQGREKLRLLKR